MNHVSGFAHSPTIVQPGQKVRCPGSNADHPKPHTLKPGTPAVQLVPVTISGAMVKASAGIGITMCQDHYNERETGHAKPKSKKH